MILNSNMPWSRLAVLLYRSTIYLQWSSVNMLNLYIANLLQRKINFSVFFLLFFFLPFLLRFFVVQHLLGIVSFDKDSALYNVHVGMVYGSMLLLLCINSESSCSSKGLFRLGQTHPALRYSPYMVPLRGVVYGVPLPYLDFILRMKIL